jgi:isopenicillin N synthase-like dioxygenase
VTTVVGLDEALNPDVL